MKRRFSLLCAVVLSLTLLQLAGPARAQQTGVSEGVLTAKGEAWIAVLADGEQQPTKLIPRWVGGLPRNGGGLDKRMLLLFRELVIGSRLKVSWLRDEHVRVVEIQVLNLPGQETEKNETNQNEAPAQKEGAFAGIVLEKGENWISIRPNGEQEPKKFFPRWIGGLPKDGGGFDKEALRAIREVSVGAAVQVGWKWEERLRLTSMRVITAA